VRKDGSKAAERKREAAKKAAARKDEGHLSFCTGFFWNYRDSTYKREWARLNGRVALVQAGELAKTDNAAGHSRAIEDTSARVGSDDEEVGVGWVGRCRLGWSAAALGWSAAAC
jgi:hypothetical protein